MSGIIYYREDAVVFPCFTLFDTTVSPGIDNDRSHCIECDLNNKPIYPYTYSTVHLGLLYSQDTHPKELGDIAWEVFPTFSRDAHQNKAFPACIVLVDMNCWIPRPDLGDKSILLDVYADNTCLICCPYDNTILQNTRTNNIMCAPKDKPPIILEHDMGNKISRTHTNVSKHRIIEFPTFQKNRNLSALADHQTSEKLLEEQQSCSQE